MIILRTRLFTRKNDKELKEIVKIDKEEGADRYIARYDLYHHQIGKQKPGKNYKRVEKIVSKVYDKRDERTEAGDNKEPSTKAEINR